MIDKNKLAKALGAIVAVFAVVGIATYMNKQSSMTLDEYGQLHPEALLPVESSEPDDAQLNISSGDVSGQDMLLADMSNGDSFGVVSGGNISEGDVSGTDISGSDTPVEIISPDRVTYVTEAGEIATEFYYEPLSAALKERITGISYPAEDNGNLGIRYEDLRYVHILHYNFDGMSTEGELICNEYIADDLLDIFYELHRNEYQLERVRLIDEYNGDDTASMEDNNTSCFNYRVVDNTTSLSKHALGLALDINPFYNPYVTYPNGNIRISPKGSEPYADRNADFPYKIDEDDLCYKLFTEHGFTWGGNWNSLKDYQHFQKTP